ncbi:MAG: helix-turn-helix transcriptional regulator [Bacilli bacterium]|nr:helix-turn-helix transcriptional regulator [Bacilli bacterium]MDD3305414.1 helix-turn-helix transcriptional regulator [Bacilli bacterium]MDD4054140.1 helix-turn-helix transcriptional regulator [Bacilli bacterium]
MHYLDRIKALREDNDLTQAAIGKKLKISQRVYSHYETGQRSIPIEIICDLADIYNTSTDYILGKTNNRNQKK